MKNRIKTRSFFTRTFVLLIIMLLLLGCLNVMLLLRIRELYLEQDYAQMHSVFSLAADIVNERINTRIQMLSSIAWLGNNNKEQDPSVALAELQERCRFYNRIKDRMNYKRFMIADEKGDVLTPEERGYNIYDYDFFQRALRGFSSTSSVILDPAAKERIHGAESIVLSTPVYMGAYVVGTLSAVMDTSEAASFLKGIDIPYSGANLFLIDGENSVISNSGVFSDPQMYFSGSTKVFNFMGRRLSPEERKELAVQMASADGATVHNYTSKSTGRSVSYVTLPNTGNWKLVAVSSNKSIRGAQQKLMIKIGAVFAALTLLLIGITLLVYYYAWRFVRLLSISDGVINSSGLHLLTLHPSGRAYDFKESFAKLLGLPPETPHFKFDEIAAAGQKKFPQAPFKGGESLRLCCAAPDGRRVYLHLKILEADPSGVGQALAIDITEDEKLQRRVRGLAYVNQLTRLPNIEVFQQKIRTVMAVNMPASYQAACCFVEINDGHKILEIFGSPVYNKMIAETARRLSDVVKRFNAELYSLRHDDFVIYHTFNEPRELSALCYAVKEAFSAPFNIDSNTFEVRVVIGIVTYREYIANRSVTPDDIFRRGEIALRQAKENEGLYIIDEKRYRSIIRSLDLEMALQNALKNGEMELYYQPIYDVLEDRITSVEALSRWHSARYGEIPPSVFIPLAEANGFINELSDWVARESIAFAKRLLALGEDVAVEFNVSMVQLAQTDFVAKLLSKVEEAGLPAERLGVEITESNGFESASALQERLRPFKEAGIAIFIDDFGTGYSSVSYLKDLGADYLKIDKSFVKGVENSLKQREIIKAIITVARATGHGVVAEGVESGDELAALLDIGCLKIQGYLIAKPLNGEALLRFLKEFRGGGTIRRA